MIEAKELMKDFISGDAMLTGVDSGNTSTKVSVLDREGNIKSYQFPTVIAPAPSELSELAEHQSNEMEGIQKLHVRITSDALPKKASCFYVGEYARDKKDKEEPSIDDSKKANKPLHIVTTLTALAVAAWETGRSGEVLTPFSGGLPINEISEGSGMKYLRDFIGKHKIEAIDGPYKGKEIVLNIENGIVNVEGVTSELGLRYDIENGEIKELPIGDRIGERFAVVDGGAGTLDIGLFDEDGFNASLSVDYKLGTNQFIDQLIEKVEKEIFKEYYEIVQQLLDEDKDLNPADYKPYRTREAFMREVIFPGVAKMIENKHDKNYRPVFHAKWGTRKADPEKLTELVLETMEAYVSEVLKKFKRFELSTSVDSFIFVGGGLLFGYYSFRNLDSEHYIFPDDLNKAASLTSNAYLIRNYLEQLGKKAER